MRGVRGWGCAGSGLESSANKNRVSEVSRAGLSAGWGRQALLTALSLVGGGLRDGFMAFKRPPPLTSRQIAKGNKRYSVSSRCCR